MKSVLPTVPERITPAPPGPADLPREPPGGLALRVNFAWTIAGNVVYAGCQWAMLAVLAKLGNPEMVGQYALGLAVTAPVVMFTNLQLRAVQATDARGEYGFGHYLSLRLITTSLALAAIAAIVLAAGYRPETALVVLAVGLAKGVESVGDVFHGLFQRQERMDRLARSMVLRGVLALAALGVAVSRTGSVFWGALGVAVAWVVVLAAYDLPSGAAVLRAAGPGPGAADSLRPRWDPRVLGRLAWLALPLGVVMMLISLTANLPRYFIEAQLGERELGLFGALAYLTVAGNTVMAALGQSATPRLARAFSGGDVTAFRRLLGKLMGVGAAAGALGVLAVLVAGRPILTLLYTAEYAGHNAVFLGLTAAAGVGFVASFLGYGMTAARRFAAQAPLFGAVAVGTAAACAVLIPRYGLRGAALATLASALLQLAGSAAVVFHAVRVRERGLS